MQLLPFLSRHEALDRWGGRMFQEIRAEGRTRMTETVWKFEQLRAGQIYNQVMFNTREEAESFAAQMSKMAPDLFCRIEPVEARMWWN